MAAVVIRVVLLAFDAAETFSAHPATRLVLRPETTPRSLLQSAPSQGAWSLNRCAMWWSEVEASVDIKKKETGEGDMTRAFLSSPETGRGREVE